MEAGGRQTKMVLFLQPGLLKLPWELGPELGPEVLGQQILLGFNDPPLHP